MKKALAWLLVIAMTAALAVGGTLAYLTDTDEDVNVMTVGKVKIDQLEYEREDPETNGDDATVQEFHNNKPLYPSVIKDGFDWDTSKSTTMYATFYWCKSLKEIKGLADWDVSSVTNMDQMFRNCHELTSLDIAGWRPGKCTTFSSMFSDGDSNTGYMKLKELDIGQWDMSSAQNINWMFYGCGQLTELDLSGWDTSNITTMHHAFADCMKMETYNFTGWDTSKVTTMDGIFNSNKALKSVDVSEFDTQNVVDFDQFFDGCTSLEEIIGLDKWDTSKGQTFGEFLLNTKVRVLDLSSFDMSSATYVVNMFHINYELTTIYAGDNWNLNPDQLSQTGGMINYSPKLVGGQGTTYSSSDASYMRIDGGEEAPGYLTYKPAQ